ncbi:MAG: hypothetical protein ABTQ27_12040 [Amaricoccus sp.]|uniref:hypothetical protein n=1 Tax=Amaricoccus sp. TaxID=1872485 RepID=UPI003314D507
MTFEGICEIRRAGVASGGQAQLDLRAENGAFDWRWFLSQDGIGREVLAIALAAIVSNKKVNCVIVDPDAPTAAGGHSSDPVTIFEPSAPPVFTPVTTDLSSASRIAICQIIA